MNLPTPPYKQDVTQGQFLRGVWIQIWFGFMFNGISTFGGYLMSKPSLKKNISDTI